jgi:hypothetical protein
MGRDHTRYRPLLAAVGAGVPALAVDTAKAAPVEELSEVVATSSRRGEAWATRNAIGRFFRIGLKADF